MSEVIWQSSVTAPTGRILCNVHFGLSLQLLAMLGILLLVTAYVQGHCFWCVGYLPADMEACHDPHSHTAQTVTAGFPGGTALQEGVPFIHIRENTGIKITVSCPHIPLVTIPSAKFALAAYSKLLNSCNSFPEGTRDTYVSRKGFSSLSCLKWCTDKTQRQVAALRCITPLLPSIKTSDPQISDFIGMEATQQN